MGGAQARVAGFRYAPRQAFTVAMWLLGGLLVVFIILPMVRLALATSAGGLAGAIRNPDVRASIQLSLKDALAAAAIATLCGVPLAWVLARKHFPGKGLVEGIVDLPLAVPHTAVGIALLFVFGRKGWIGAPAGHLGISFFGTEWGIIVGMMFVSAPFVVDTVRVAIEDVDPRLEQAARTLGASQWQTFRHVTLPLSTRGVLSGFVLAYARAISEFGAVVILAYFPMTAPVEVYDLYLQKGLDESAAAAVLLLIVTLATFLVFRSLTAGGVGRWLSTRT